MVYSHSGCSFFFWRGGGGEGYLQVANIKTDGPHKFIRDNKQIRGPVSIATMVLHRCRRENSMICSDKGLHVVLKTPTFTFSKVANLPHQYS